MGRNCIPATSIVRRHSSRDAPIRGILSTGSISYSRTHPSWSFFRKPHWSGNLLIGIEYHIHNKARKRVEPRDTFLPLFAAGCTHNCNFFQGANASCFKKEAKMAIDVALRSCLFVAMVMVSSCLLQLKFLIATMVAFDGFRLLQWLQTNALDCCNSSCRLLLIDAMVVIVTSSNSPMPRSVQSSKIYQGGGEGINIQGRNGTIWQ